MSNKTFSPGTVVVFEPKNFDPEYWDSLTDVARQELYGHLGYGYKKTKFFVFLCEIVTAPGHCVLVATDTNKVETMRHISNFREVGEDEF